MNIHMYIYIYINSEASDDELDMLDAVEDC